MLWCYISQSFDSADVVGGVIVACVASIFVCGMLRNKRSRMKRYKYSSQGTDSQRTVTMQGTGEAETAASTVPLLIEDQA